MGGAGTGAACLRRGPGDAEAWAELQQADRLWYRVATSRSAPSGTPYLQDSSTSPLIRDAAPWFEITDAVSVVAGTGTQVSDPDELRWRAVEAAAAGRGTRAELRTGAW